MTIDVLVVDEEADVLEITEAFLERQDGLAVSTEEDPERALERVVDGDFDAVVSDLTMPELDGLELCCEIHDAGVEIPFFLFSGRDASDVPDHEGKQYLTGHVRKGTGTEQYETIAEQIRTAVE